MSAEHARDGERGAGDEHAHVAVDQRPDLGLHRLLAVGRRGRGTRVAASTPLLAHGALLAIGGG